MSELTDPTSASAASRTILHGPANERTQMKIIRELTQQASDGASPRPLQQALITLYARVYGGVLQFTQSRARAPQRAAWFDANLDAYSAALDAIESMDDALAADDLSALTDAFYRLQVAETRVNDLVTQEAPQTPAAG